MYHADPSASQIDDWTEWVIPLRTFADQGVNLTNVNTISIGFGDKASSQPGGTGTVYVDDINEWANMNEVYRTYFPKAPPARSAMAASGIALNARVEIECIAVVGHEQHQ